MTSDAPPPAKSALSETSPTHVPVILPKTWHIDRSTDKVEVRRGRPPKPYEALSRQSQRTREYYRNLGYVKVTHAKLLHDEVPPAGVLPPGMVTRYMIMQATGLDAIDFRRLVNGRFIRPVARCTGGHMLYEESCIAEVREQAKRSPKSIHTDGNPAYEAELARDVYEILTANKSGPKRAEAITRFIHERAVHPAVVEQILIDHERVSGLFVIRQNQLKRIMKLPAFDNYRHKITSTSQFVNALTAVLSQDQTLCRFCKTNTSAMACRQCATQKVREADAKREEQSAGWTRG